MSAPKATFTASLSDHQIRMMIEAFLRWELPQDFNPDGGISFKRVPGHTPTGTNLLTFSQADDMVIAMLDAIK